MMRKAGVLTGVALLVGLGAAYGCGSSFRTCDQTRTCAPQSEGGPDASTEAAPPDAARDGDASSSSCTTNADCDDGKACDGVERCVNGACVAGKPVTCANPDPAHCNAVCVEAGGGATNCEVQPRDADGDGHGDALCTEAKVPGDDCNDTNKNVYPGAPEICDGLDDNCNGKVDDGLPLGGTNGTLLTSPGQITSVAIAWSASAKVYGVVWTDSRNNQSEIYFGRMDPTAMLVGCAYPITNDSLPNDSAAIAAGGDSFGVVWAADGVSFQRVGFDGTLMSGSLSVSTGLGSSPQIGWDGSSGYVVTWTETTNLMAARLDATGAVQGTPGQVGQVRSQDYIGQAQLAVNGTAFSVTYNDGSGFLKTLGIDTVVLDKSAGVTASRTLADFGSPAFSFAAVGSGPTGALSVWTSNANADALDVELDGPDGSQQCSAPQVVSGAGGAGDTYGPACVVFHDDQFAVLGGEGSQTAGGLKLARIDGSCHAVAGPLLVGSQIGIGDASAAEGDNQLAIVFSDNAVQPSELLRRLIGPHYCD